MGINGKRNIRFLALLLFYFLIACGGGGDTSDDGQIGPNGGSVSSVDGQASITIPKGSLSETVTITVVKAETYPTGVIDGTAYDIGPDGLLFTLPATLTIHYTETQLPAGTDESSLWLAKLSHGQWVRVAGYTVDSDSNTISAELDSFSLYAIGTGSLPDTVEKSIDQNGGTLTSDDGLATIDVPQGALSTVHTLTVTQTNEYPPGVFSGTVYTFGPDGLQFDKPVTMTIQYDEASLPAGIDESTIWIAELINGSWRKLSDYTVDSTANTVSASIDGFSIYGLGSGDEFVDITSTVYIVDQIAAGHSDQFIELSDALDYLNNHLAVTESGKIVIQTNRDLSVQKIDLNRTIVFERAEGYTGKITGPGSSPLIINANISAALAGMQFVNAGGVQINAIGNLSLTNNTLPATTVSYAGVGSQKFNQKALTARDNGLIGDNWTVAKNQIAGPLNLYSSAGFGLSLDLGENNAPSVRYQGVAAAGANVHIYKNLTDFLGLYLSAGASAKVKVDNHTDLNSLEATLELLENANYDMEFIHSATAKLDFDGKATAGVTFKSNNVEKLETVFSAATTLNFLDDEGTYDDVKIHQLTGEVDFSLTRMMARLQYQFYADENTKATLNVGAGVDYQGSGLIDAKGELIYKFSDDAKVGAFFVVKASGGQVNGSFEKVTSTAGMFLDYRQVYGKIYGQFGTDTTFQNQALEIYIPEVADAAFNINGGVYAEVGFHWDEQLEPPGSQKPGVSRAIKRAGEGGITIRDATFNSVNQGAAGVAISRINQAVTIEGCTFSGSNTFAINLGELNGDVTIKDNTLNDAGINLTEVRGAINVSNNQINAPTSTQGVMVAFTDKVTLSNNTVTAVTALFAVADTEVRADSNTFNGNITAGGGEILPGRIGLTNNTFGAATIVTDATGQAGGFYDDPMANGNSGLQPAFITSLIDWNEPHPCADYPPERNVKDNEGNCVLDGVSPP